MANPPIVLDAAEANRAWNGAGPMIRTATPAELRSINAASHPVAPTGRSDHDMRTFIAAAALAAASLGTFAGTALVGPAAGALIPNGGLVDAPEYCMAIYGDPAPCPPPERPPANGKCLRVDVAPLTCPYRP
jgi:hypothetical protein